MADEPHRPVNRIRPVSRPTHSAYSRLKSMQNFAEVDRRVRLGWSPNDVAVSIHEEFKELLDVSVKYLKKLIERYRTLIPPAELSAVSPNSLLGKHIAKRMSQGIDELAELERLYQVHIERIDIDIANEKRINKLLPSTQQEIVVAMKLLKQSSDLKMDLGLTKRQLGSMEVTGTLAADATTRYGRESVGKTIADPESRRNVLGIAEKLMLLAEKAGIDAVNLATQISNRDVIDVVDNLDVEIDNVD